LNTSSILSWALIIFTQHPEWETILVEEVRSICSGTVPTYEEFLKLTKLHAFMNEVLRLYTPSTILARDSIAEDEIMGYPVEANSAMAISTFHIHRHPDYWVDPGV